jgi:hypothetical protein
MQIIEILEDRSGASVTSLGGVRPGSGPRSAFGNLLSTLNNIRLNIAKNGFKKSVSTLKDVGGMAIAYSRNLPKQVSKDFQTQILDPYPTGTLSRWAKKELPELQKYQNANGTFSYRRLKSEQFKDIRHLKLEAIQGKPVKKVLALINRVTLGQNTYGYIYLYPIKGLITGFNLYMLYYTIKKLNNEGGPMNVLAFISAAVQVPYDMFMQKGKLLFDIVIWADILSNLDPKEWIATFWDAYKENDEYTYEEVLTKEIELHQGVNKIQQQLAAQVNNSYTETMQQLNKIEKSVNYFHNNPQDEAAALAYVKENYTDLPKDYMKNFAIKLLEDCAHPEPILAEIKEFKDAMKEINV